MTRTATTVALSEQRRPHCIAGIDPGMTGALAFFYTAEPAMLDVMDLPIVGREIDAAALFRCLTQIRPDAAILEAVHTMPGQGIASSGRLMQVFGTIIGVIASAGIPLYRTPPTVWKKHYRLGSDKEAARARAIALWPTSEAFGLKKSHNRAEAALIARFGAEVLLGAGQ